MKGVENRKVEQFARRVFNVSGDDQRSVAQEGVDRLKAFWASIGMPVTMKELGVENPDIDKLIDKLHANKGDAIGGYYKLTMDDCREIYELAK